MDPRIRARRVAVARQHGRRRLRRLLVAVALLAIATGAVGAMFSPLLDVDRVAVEGAPADRAAEVRKAVGAQRGQPLLLVDTAAIATRVEALPWVATADVSRELPGALEVTVRPRVAAGWARAADGTVLLVDGSGRVLGAAASSPAGLPELRAGSVDRGDRTVAPAAARVGAALTPAVRAQVSSVEFAHGEATLVTASGLPVRLGAPRGLAAKLRAAEAMLRVVADHPVAYLDVRVPSAPVTGGSAGG